MIPILFALFTAQVDTGGFTIRNFYFASGETLSQLRVHYRTLGHPHRSASGTVTNAVLILHGTGGTGAQFLAPVFAGELFGRGQPLDTASHYLILPDNVGHGGSSKPSDGLHARFPHYGYTDMVEAQYRLLTQGLGVDHLELVVGTSMGCMHAWIWAEQHVGFMDGVVPLACAPRQIAGRNRMLRRMILDDTRTDSDWRGGDYPPPPHPPGLPAPLHILSVMSSSPLQLQRAAPTRDSADAYISRWIDARAAPTDANDILYQFDPSRDYDPRPDLARITAPVLAINSADDLINPPELGLMKRLIPRVPPGRDVLISTSQITPAPATHTLPPARHHSFPPLSSVP